MSAQPAKVTLPHPAPANDPPQMRTFKALVEEYGFKSTRALGGWLRRRKIPYTRDGGYNWADRNRVAAAIARGRVVEPAPDPQPASPSVAAWFEQTLGAQHRGT